MNPASSARLSLAVLLSFVLTLPGTAQDESVNPGINDSFQDPKPTEYVERFEKEGREVYDNRELIVEKLGLEPGMAVADVGAGTGLFTRLIAARVGPSGRVYAVDIAKAFVDHTVMSSHARGLKNVEGVVCAPDDVKLPPGSVDLVFLCDTYHHFEFPYRTMASIAKALKPGGRVAMIDFERIEGKSSDWILDHVRAGKEVFREEIEASGFEFVEELDLFEENYFLVFRKR